MHLLHAISWIHTNSVHSESKTWTVQFLIVSEK